MALHSNCFHHAINSGQTETWRPFKDFAQFRRILLEDEEQLARNLSEKLLVYATGAGPQFTDRPVIEAILSEVKPSKYGLRSLILGIAQSRPFREK